MENYIISEKTDFTFNDYIEEDFALEIEDRNKSLFKSKTINYLKFTTTGIMLLSSSANLEASIFEPTLDSHHYECSEQYLGESFISNILDYTEYLQYFEKEDSRQNSFQKIEQITADVLSFISLKENWDGFGAYPLEKVGAVNALSVINSLGTEIAGNISDVYPNSHGTVSCEWESESSFLSLEIGNSTFSYYKEYKGKTLYYDNLLLNDKNILTLKNNLQSFV